MMSVTEHAIGMTMTVQVLHLVGMAVCMRMAVSSMSVIMPGMSVAESEQAHHVDKEAEDTDNQKLLNPAEFCAFHDAFNGLPNKLDTDHHQEDTVAEPGKSVELAPAIGLLRACRPLACDSSSKADNQSETVEKHVYSVAE